MLDLCISYIIVVVAVVVVAVVVAVAVVVVVIVMHAYNVQCVASWAERIGNSHQVIKVWR